MRRVHMFKERETRVGKLRANQTYPLPDDLAAEMVSEDAGVYLDPEPVERAVDEPEEVRHGA